MRTMTDRVPKTLPRDALAEEPGTRADSPQPRPVPISLWEPDEPEPEGNLKRWILEAAAGQTIEGVAIGDPEAIDSNYHEVVDESPVLSWEKAERRLDMDFWDSFGCGDNCAAITAWTKNRVIFVSTYDGSTQIAWVPRHPVAHIPLKFGG